MKVRQNKTSITFSEVYNEGMLEVIQVAADKSGVNMKAMDMGGTKYKITGTQAQLSAFVAAYNE